MTFLLMLLACNGADPTETASDPTDTAPDADSGQIDTAPDTDTDTTTLTLLLGGPLHGWFVTYDAELDAEPDQDGWIHLPTLWTWGDGTLGAGPFAAFIYTDDPEAGGTSIDAYAGQFQILGSSLALNLQDETGATVRAELVIPTITEAEEITYPWTMDDGTAGAVYLNPAWDPSPDTGTDTDTGAE